MRTVHARSSQRIPLAWPAKDADEVLECSVDFSDRLGTDDILTATFSLATAAGLVIDSSEHDSCKTATVTLSGGTTGSKGKVLCRITTRDGQTMDETVALLIRAK